MSNFIQRVSAENFPVKIQWTTRDSLVLLIIPMTLMLGYLLTALDVSKLHVAVVDTLLRGLLFTILCVAYRSMLRHHWQKFCQAFWRSILLVMIGGVLIQVIISMTRSLLPISLETQYDSSEQAVTLSFISQLFISFAPLFTALIEDIIFRYTLLQKLFVKPLIWRIFIVLANSILFGLIHFQNFSGNLTATISFMSAGLFLNLIYLWTKNIWHVLLIHFLNNTVLSLLASIVLIITQ